jgi:hypothetical protein
LNRRNASFVLPLFCVSILAFAGCPGLSDSEEDGEVTRRERDVSGQLAVSLGGVAPQQGEILIDEALTSLTFENNDPDLFDLEFRPGFSSFSAGKGARVIPRETGIGYVTPFVNGRGRDPIEIVIPPQKLVQILLGEARGELDREATTEGTGDEERVKPGSVSVTGEAVAAVIRNRIDLINEEGSPSLFLADAGDYGSDPPLSYYDAVIEASNGEVFQFSPVKPGDPSHEIYLDAEAREDMDENLLIAYDQAVLTAAEAFSGDVFDLEGDPTGGAFAFYSPTPTQSALLEDTLESGSKELPEGCGTSDANFPAFAPVQVLILREIAPSVLGGGVPSFVFVRFRSNLEPAITDEP